MPTLGIILAGGKSTRLYPATLATTKQTLPVYDKPLIYYPLTTLMLSGIRDFVIISTPEDKKTFETLFFDCKEQLGINIHFAVQTHPRGIADAFNVIYDDDRLYDLSEKFERFALILGDNIFYGSAMSQLLGKAATDSNNAYIFATKVHDPERFGVVEIEEGKAISIEEKPKVPKSDLAVTGLYFYPCDVFERVRNLKPSKRSELEITDLNRTYLEDSRLNVVSLLRGMVWFDTGTHDSLLEAAQFIQAIQKHQGYVVGSPHEVAFHNGWIDEDQLENFGLLCGKSQYGDYLQLMAFESRYNVKQNND